MKLLAVGLILTFYAALSYGDDPPPEKLERRTPFRIHLAKISVAFDEQTRGHNQVHITFDESQSYAVIAPGDDMFVRKNRYGNQTTVYSEIPEKAYQLSDFEAKQISRVSKGFISTLEEFEKSIKNGDWGKCLYLDAYFPRFLRGFHVMICAAKGSREALPRNALVMEGDYDVSLNSKKSDTRVNMWRESSDKTMKLRIAARELAHHAREWQKKELDNSKRNTEYSYSSDFDRAFTSFVKNYFGYNQ
jgi:hypothetical protein